MILEQGRLTARPGPDRYLYTFETPGGPRPEIGRRGMFIFGPRSFPASLTDCRGPRVVVSLEADRPLGPRISGLFQPAPPLPPPDLTRAAEPGAGPPGLPVFFDPADGWVMSVTEAASQKAPLFNPGHWPRVTRAELPGRLSSLGPTFIWRQRPDGDSATAARLITHFLSQGGRVLAAGESPGQLEPLAELPGAVFTGPAQPGTPLHPVSVYTRTAEALEAREQELGRLRNAFNDLKREEAAVKARLANWEDLEGLERRFLELGREVEQHTRRGDEARRTLALARETWQTASLALETPRRGLLGRRKEPDEKSRRREANDRRALEAAETSLAEVRREEEQLLAEARHLESRLSQQRREAEAWTAREALEADLTRVRHNQEQLAARVVAVETRPRPAPPDFLPSAPLVLTLIGDLACQTPPGPAFSHVAALVESPPDHSGRQRLAALASLAAKNLVILGDFTLWPVWSGRIPLVPGFDAPAWANCIVAEEADEFQSALAGGDFWSDPAADEAGSRPPAPRTGGPKLSRLEWTREIFIPETQKNMYMSQPPDPEAAPDFSSPAKAPRPEERGELPDRPGCGLGLRALGDLGPANPVSALFTARAAVRFTLARPGESEPAVIVLTASAAQSRLVSLMVKDLGAPPGRIFCGEPQDFNHWPPAPLVIVEPAFEAPHLGHPWAWPSFGRQKLTWAWKLARERIWLCGRDGWMRRLPQASPLAALWRLAGPPDPEADMSAVVQEGSPPTFWDALDKARQEVWAVVPTFESFWWRPLEEHFLSAARRRVQVTLLSPPPTREADREYAGSVIKTLSTYGCSVQLAAGFPGFLAVVDGSHLSWGHFLEDARGRHIWGGLQSAVLPQAAPEIGRVLQIDLINEKLGRRSGGLKTCRFCGWPLVLINQEHSRGFGDEQPLKVGCLGDCQGRRAARRLDEREPFASPPRCGLDRSLFYQRLWRGRQEIWVCPQHPDGPQCPSFRVIPGDARGDRR